MAQLRRIVAGFAVWSLAAWTGGACDVNSGGTSDADDAPPGDCEDCDAPPDPGREDAREDARDDGRDVGEDGSSCGDGRVDPGEECDDGNVDNADACLNDCTNARCGDGIVRAAAEACDDGNDVDTDACLTTCVLATCGDGQLWAGREVCDDGNVVGGDGCEADCTLTGGCGDGIVTPGEDCDDGNDANTDGCLSTCLAARCGDGFVWAGREACDDGNAIGGDGCEPDCSLSATCGNGTVEPPEACDDGNDVNTDDCLSTCLPASCGDGYVRAGVEECDSAIAYDGICTTTCGSEGVLTCEETCDFGCALPSESCNDSDDDCDGTTDEDFACRIGTPVSCTTACGTAGTGTCTAACGLPTGADCVGPAETCNGLDDDCIGGADDGFACALGASQTCAVGTCSGSQTCLAPACAWGACDLGPAPPADACGGALAEISGGGTFTGSTCTAANDYGATCGTGAASPDVVYRLELATAADVLLDTVGSSYDAVLHLHGGTTCPGTELACDDNSAAGTPGQARIFRNLAAGTYWVVVDGAGSDASGDYVLNVTVSATPPPPNDACAGAIDIDAGGVFSGSTARATDDHTYTCTPAGTGGHDVWYAFTLAARELVYLDTVDGNTWDVVLQLRSGDCASPASVVCMDDACRGYSGGVRSQIVRVLDPGTYLVVVDGWDADASGNFALRFQHAPCPDATLIAASGRFDGTTVGQGNDTAGACGGVSAPDALYYVALCGPRSVGLTTCNATTAFDTVLYVRTGECGPAAEIACNDNDPLCRSSTLDSSVTAVLPQGLSFIAVDGYFAAAGSYRLTVSGL